MKKLMNNVPSGFWVENVDIPLDDKDYNSWLNDMTTVEENLKKLLP